MKTYCKNLDINADFIEKCIYKCFEKKWNRSDVIRYLSKYSDKNVDEIRELVTVRYVAGQGCVHKRKELAPEIRKIAEQLEKEIKEKNVRLKAIKYRERYDTSSHKMRLIGIESMKQQVLDYVAVNALMDLFMDRIGDNQFACVPNRGQKFGKLRIEKWIRKHPNKCAYVAKADIKKCYPSVNTRTLKRLIRKYVKNDEVIYLVELLIDSYGGGLSIGSYLSTWLCNFYLSFAYRYASEKLVKVRRKKSGDVVTKRLIFKVCFWMDDIVMFGSRKADLIRAVKLLDNFLRSELDLQLKDDWRVYKMGFVDVMGYKIGKEFTTIRNKTFLKIRRTFMKALRSLHKFKKITIKQAQRLISFYGKIKETNSNNFKRKYKIDYIINKAKRRISHESKIFNKTATCTCPTYS